MKVEDEIWLIEFKERFFDQLDEDAKGGFYQDAPDREFQPILRIETKSGSIYNFDRSSRILVVTRQEGHPAGSRQVVRFTEAVMLPNGRLLFKGLDEKFGDLEIFTSKVTKVLFR